MYSLHFTKGQSLTSAEIVAMLDPARAEHARHIEWIAQLERRGMSYSNEDFDVLSSAHAAALRPADPLLDRLRHHVSGAIERGEATAIVEIPADPNIAARGLQRAHIAAASPMRPIAGTTDPLDGLALFDHGRSPQLF